MTAQTIQPSSRLIPISQWNEFHTWPPQGGLRRLVFHENTNGFKTAFVRVGRRVLVNEAEFFACIERKNNKAA
jgi:hypothetical protein